MKSEFDIEPNSLVLKAMFDGIFFLSLLFPLNKASL